MSKKDTIYIDIEDDITSIIDKLKKAEHNIVALVLPKRAATLQSLVNMKLLRKAAVDAKKKPVLITDESTLMPLAAQAGLPVSKDLKSMPEVPKFEEPSTEPEEIIGEEIDSKSVGELDGDKPEEIKPEKKSRGLKIPNFNKFRLKIILGITGFVLLIIAWVFAYMILPSANIVIKAQTLRVPTDISFVADSTRSGDNFEKAALSAEKQEINRTISESFTASGKKNIGTKASGTMTVKNCESSSEITITKGTKFLDPESDLQVIALSSVAVPGGEFTNQGQTCTPGESDVDVRAANAGSEYNLGPRGYEALGYGDGVTGFGSAMIGGSDEFVTVVSSKDISKAEKAIEDQDFQDIQDEMVVAFGEDSFALIETFEQSSGKATSTAKAGEEVEGGEVEVKYSFTMMGVSRSSLEQLLETEQLKEVSDNQSIIDTGIDQVVIEIDKEVSKDKLRLTAKTDGFAGPDLDTSGIAEEVSGKRFSEVVSIIESKSGVQDVEVKFSPFWVFSAPKASRINISVEVSEHILQ